MTRPLTLHHALRGALARKDVRLLVETAYNIAGEPHCCDPRDLADTFGLSPCPNRTEVAFVQDGFLYYPQDATLVQRGLAMYRFIVKHLWPDFPPYPLMCELILPETAARSATFCELAELQPHAPLSMVQSIFMMHGHSGTQLRAIRT